MFTGFEGAGNSRWMPQYCLTSTLARPLVSIVERREILKELKMSYDSDFPANSVPREPVEPEPASPQKKQKSRIVDVTAEHAGRGISIIPAGGVRPPDCQDPVDEDQSRQQ